MDHTEGNAQTQGRGTLLAGRYRLAESLGSGGMGKVWRAHDDVLHRSVAVKELTAALYASEAERAVLLARTQKEARAAARINHSAVVTVHDVFEYDERPWIVMELVDGHSLADAISQDERIDPREAARIGSWVLRALRAAHTAGVLHRDVKPANVLLSRDGRVLLTDFGIAAIEGDSTITRTGELVGSIDFLAPERVRGADPGPAADLWALGATLFTAVEGHAPFRRPSPLSTMQAVVEDDPAAMRRAGALEPVISALLRKDPEQRPSVDETERLLVQVAEGGTPHPTPSTPFTQSAQTTRSFVPTQRMPGEHPAAPPPSSPSSHSSPPKRRGGRRLLAAVVATAVLGVGAALGIVAYADREGGNGSQGGQDPQGKQPQPSASASPADNWVRVKDDAEGFSLLLPKGWKRQTASSQIDYSPDNGRHLLRIGINEQPEFQNSYPHALDMEKDGASRLPSYDRVQLRQNSFRGRDAAVWEFTWTETNGANQGTRRAIDQLYFAADGTEYALYMSGPAEGWATTRKQFEKVLRSWRP